MKTIENTKVLYQDLPFRGLDHFKSRRHDSRQRFERFASLVPIKGKSVLDMGCCEGSLSLGLKEQGAESVKGIDDNLHNIQIAREARDFLGYDVDFQQESIDKGWAEQLPHYDIIVWLSVWQWIVKREGLLYGKELLFEVSKKADVMIFESAASDGGGGIKGSTQADVEKWLLENTVYNKIEVHEPQGTWKGGTRKLFVCSHPFVKKMTKSYQSGVQITVERIARDLIKKTWKNGLSNLKEREVKALKRLDKYSHYPKLVEEGDNYIIETYCGREIRILQGTVAQTVEIADELKKEGIVHQDLLNKNLLILNNTLYVIDFSRAVFDGEVSKKNWQPHDLDGMPYTDKGALLKSI